jgi:dTDP-4-dehydrorhamnose reductase
VSATVFVIGQRGMLGRVVARYLAERGHRVMTTEHRFTGGAADPLVEAVARSDAAVVVNCAGALPSKVSAVDEIVRSNALLPQQVGLGLRDGQLLIHASTDGVFDGERGDYDRTDPPNAMDTYGMSKRLGELVRYVTPTIVIRTSIIGSGGGLLRWLTQQEGDVDGYTNQVWNGITTLEWAHVCGELIDRGAREGSEIEHVTAQEPVTKFELLRAAATVDGLAVSVRPVESPRSVNLSLIPTMARQSIRTQLEELRAWEGSGG